MSITAVAVPGRRRVASRAVAAAALLILLLVAVIGGLATQEMTTGSSQPSPIAIADISTDYLAQYERAALRFGVDWAVLAAIGKLECDHGRSRARGCNPPGTVNEAGATGPMQFLGPTWRTGTPLGAVPEIGPPAGKTGKGYATDGDGDGSADVWNPADAIAAAARLLQASGAPADYRRAVFAYNHSDEYVDRVLAKAEEYRGAFAPG